MVQPRVKRLSIPLPTIYDFSSPVEVPSSSSSCSSSGTNTPTTTRSTSPKISFKPSIADSSPEGSIRIIKRRVLTFPYCLDNILVPKSRKPRFNLTLQIHDLNNVPLVSGAAYVKWHLHNSTKGDTRGRTDKALIKEHKVNWRYERAVSNIRMTVDRNGMLNEQLVMFEINQEYSGRERIMLGTVTLNLAEYAGVEKETRRYLMQDSKINSTLKITIAMTQVSGDTNFYAPPLRGAQVFGGIAGIISNGDQQPSQKTQKKDLDIMSLASRSREMGAKQDMYRGTLTASWHLQAGELDAEECIEDIFAGGDGWVSNGTHLSPNSDSIKASSKLSLAEVGSDSDSQSAGTGGSGGSISERRRMMRSNTRDADAKSLAGSERRKAFVLWGMETGLETLGSLGSAGLPKFGRKFSDGSILKIPNHAEKELNGRVEVDEVAAREDLKSWGKVR
ncbi:N-terminal C2 in EEIG1 and EHBP1 proteins-domain-containing protein [Tirmania nivea]|nr:N-terminal C2 in EEIG1 and EHBP1 proteins-domain-containing protein [Tirmania nivea]